MDVPIVGTAEDELFDHGTPSEPGGGSPVKA
jgi:hypothetical protein